MNMWRKQTEVSGKETLQRPKTFHDKSEFGKFYKMSSKNKKHAMMNTGMLLH